MSRPPAVLRPATEVLPAAVLAVLATLPFGRLLGGGRFLLLAAGAALLSVVVALAMARRALAVSIAASTVALGAYLGFAVFHVGLPVPGDLGDVWSGTTGSWALLLSAPVPAPSTPGLLALPVVLAWVAAASGGELALRRRLATAPIFPSFGLLAVALAFAGRHGTSSGLLPAAMAVVALGTVLVRAGGRGGAPERPAAARAAPQARTRQATPPLLAGLPVALVAVAFGSGASAVWPATAAEARFDLHDRYHQPLDVGEAISPLALVGAGLRNGSTEPAFYVRFTGAPKELVLDRVRVAVLDDYDGSAWTTSARFAAAGPTLPAAPGRTPRVATVHQEYRLTGYARHFLPVLDRPTRISGFAVGFDSRNGMVLAVGQPQRGTRYEADSELVVPTRMDRRVARSGLDEPASQFRSSPARGWSSELVEFASQISAGDGTDLATAKAIEAELRSERFGYSVDAPPGHSLASLGEFVGEPDPSRPAAGVGTAEQFAATFAALARIRGLPSRVVVGYRIDPIAAAAGKDVPVLPSAVHAWAEVHLGGEGWVAFDPTNPSPRAPQQAPTPGPAAPVVPDPVTATTGVPSPVARSPRGQTPPPALPGPGWLWLVAVAAPAVGIPAGIVGAKRARRRRRRTAGRPADQVMGAWKETCDRLRAIGVVVRPTMTVSDVAVLCRAASPEAGPLVAAFRPMVNRTVFSGRVPSGEEVAAAWRAEEDVARTVRSEVGWFRRARAVLDPRALTRRRGRPGAPRWAAARAPGSSPVDLARAGAGVAARGRRLWRSRPRRRRD